MSCDFYYCIDSRFNGLHYQHFETDPAWAAEYRATRACSSDLEKRFCDHEHETLQINPLPLNCIVQGEERGFAGCVDPPVTIALRDDARDILEPHLPTAVWGSVLRRTGKSVITTSFSTVLFPRGDWVDCNRGINYIPKKQCAVCGQIYSISSSVREMGIIRREAKNRQVFIGNRIWLCVSPDFFEAMNLKSRLADLKVVCKIKVFDDDPAGWVVPGDPGWNGVLVQRIAPVKIPKAKK